MIWQNAWAFAGLLLLALPVLIHLLSRKRAVLQKFPSLRFLDVTRLLPTRSPNLSDIPLLLVRLAILAVAVFALAQPLYVSATRQQSLNASLARAIVVDTSRSMMRPSAATKTIADSAHVLAEQLGREASASVVLQTADVSSVLPGAVAWLAMQPGRSEVVVISDFQRGAIDSAAVASLPTHIGFRPVQIQGNSAVVATPMLTARTSVTATVDAGRTNAEWTDHNTSDPGVTVLEIYVAVLDDRYAIAARDAASLATSPGLADSLRPVGIVFRGAAETAAFIKDAKTPAVPWMGRALLAVRDNPLLVSSAASESVSDTVIAAPFAVVASSSSGAPVVYAAQTMIKGVNRLLFFNRGNTSAITSAALIAAVSNAVAQPSALAESETTMLTDVSLKQLARAPQELSVQGRGSERKASAQAGLSDGRWLWLVALLLLGVETWMRRTAARDVALEAA